MVKGRIKKMKKTKHLIPVILSSDNNYARFMYTTMLSMLENKNLNTFYDFYLMVPSAFSKKNQNNIYKLMKNYECNINFIDMKSMFSDKKMHIKHITTPTYYRLLAADLLPKKYNKCLYLDVDVCVLQDLYSLLKIDMGDNYIAGVPAIAYYLNNESTIKRLNIPSAKNYINAGVLIMNLKIIREKQLTRLFLQLSENDYLSQDQDILNISCFDHIKILQLKYNVMTKYDFANIPKEQQKIYNYVYGKNNIKEALEKPVIIHYADKIKPWYKKRSRFAKYWWKYAKKSPFKINFIIRYFIKKFSF